MYSYQIQVQLKSGQTLTGLPVTTVIEQQQEFLLLESGNTGTDVKPEKITAYKILLIELKSMTVLTKNARFTHIDF